MSKRISEHIRTNVVGYIALFCFALGGTAYATHPGGANTISSDDIINGQVLEPDIAANAVRGSEIQDSSVGGADIIDDAVRGPDVRENTLDFNVLQKRLLSGCAGGLAISAIDAAGNPTCVGSGGPPSGPAGGDLTGTYPNPEIAADSVGASELAGISFFDVGENSINDPAGASATDTVLLDSGAVGFSYQVIGRCNQNPANTFTAKVLFIRGSGGTAAVDSTAENGVDDLSNVAAGTEVDLVSVGATTGDHVAGGTYTVFGLSSTGTNVAGLSGTVGALTNAGDGADCRFYATGLID